MAERAVSLTRQHSGRNYVLSVEDGDAPGIVWAWVTMNRYEDKREWSASYACAMDTGELSFNGGGFDSGPHSIPQPIYDWLGSEEVIDWLAEAGY